MPRWKKPSPGQTTEMLRQLALCAGSGELRITVAVAQMRKAIGLTQEEFATLLNMTRRQIAEIEGGKANPTLDTLERIGTLFGFTTGFVPISARAEQPDNQNSARTNFEDLKDKP